MAKLPAIDAAVVEDAKLTGYLLDAGHPKGGPKARFLAAFGFVLANADALRLALLAHAAAHDISSAQASSHGVRYAIDGPLDAPDGRAPVVRVVWFNRTSESFPRLVTLIPRRMTRP